MVKIELKRPTLILGCGISGSGKSTFLEGLVTEIYDAFLLPKDTLNVAYLSTKDSSEGIKGYRFSEPVMSLLDPPYQKHVKFQTYHAMLMLARDNLQVGKHPILEGNYTKENRAGYIEEVVLPFMEGVDFNLKIILCHADPDMIFQRIVERQAKYRDGNIMDRAEFEKLLEAQPILPPELERYDHVKIDTTEPHEQNLQKVLEYLQRITQNS